MDTATFRAKVRWWKRFSLMLAFVLLPLMALSFVLLVYGITTPLLLSGGSRWFDVIGSSVMLAIPAGVVLAAVAEVRVTALWIAYVESVASGGFPFGWIDLLNDRIVQERKVESLQEFIGQVFHHRPSFLVYEVDLGRLLMPHRGRMVTEFVIRDEGELMKDVLSRLRAAKAEPPAGADVHPGSTYVIRNPCDLLR